jgi:hypothetical protein
VANNYKIYHSLTELNVQNYTSRTAFMEIMYIKHKFPNLQQVRLTSEYDRLWEPLSDLNLDAIFTYLDYILLFGLTVR